MEGENLRISPEPRRASNKKTCCVFWCREEAVIVVQLNAKKYNCCRKHADFVKNGKIDWVEP